MTPSQLSKRVNALRNAQCVYSQWRCGEVLLIGPYPRRLGLVPQQECRWCNGPVETVHHMLTDCPAVAHYRDRHGLSLETPRWDSEKGANNIFNFQQHLLATLPPSPIQQPGRVRKRGASAADAPPATRRRLDLGGESSRPRTAAPKSKGRSAARPVANHRAGTATMETDGSKR